MNTENDLNTRLETLVKEHKKLFDLFSLFFTVSNFEPQEEWIHPILNSIECTDLKTQLLTAIEDYETQQKL